jgi:hypothetical protein
MLEIEKDYLKMKCQLQENQKKKEEIGDLVK